MSSMQVDTWGRGFSYAYDAPLDMRMDPDQELTAEEIVNTWDERRLARLLREYGEERYAGQIGRAIGRRRRREEIVSTQQLVEVIKSAVPIPAQFAGGHPARRTFQALRIAVNDELAQIEERAAGGLGDPRPGRPDGRDLLPLARGPARQALPRRAVARLHLPARAADLRLRPRARGRAADPSCRGAHPGGGRRQPEISISAPARRPQAGGTAVMTPAALTPAARRRRPSAASPRPTSGPAHHPRRAAPATAPPRRAAARGARAGLRPRRPARPAALGPSPAPRAARGPGHAPTAPRRRLRRARDRPSAPGRPRRRGRASSSAPFPITGCSTASSAAAPGSRSWRCC